MPTNEIVDLTQYIGQPGGPRSVQEAEEKGRYEARWAEVDDHFGAREGDVDHETTESCVCQHCRFYRGEGGVRYIMCRQEWEALPPEVRIEINDSVNG